MVALEIPIHAKVLCTISLTLMMRRPVRTARTITVQVKIPKGMTNFDKNILLLSFMTFPDRKPFSGGISRGPDFPGFLLIL
jgi:hypothetical protein